MAYSPDGQTLATFAADKSVLLWDVGDPDHPHQLGEPLTDAAFAVAFSPDGHTLATSSSNATSLLWDISDPTRPRRMVGPVTGPTQVVNVVAFSPDGRTLATGSFDATVVMSDVSGISRIQSDPIGQACLLTGRGLRPDEWADVVPNLDYINTCSR